MRCIPWEEVVWLLHGSSAPLLHARVPEEDPVLSLPGEDDAFRLRCLAKVDPVAMVRPTELIGLLPGFDLSTRLRSPASEKMFCGYQDRRQSPKLVVEYHDHGLGYRESSAGFSLAIWFLSKKDKDVRTLDWREVPRMELEQFAPFLHVFNVYQALRLPGLRLLLELRANRLPKEVFMRQFADEHKLPLSLVARRMHDLAGRERELTWF